jgi:serine protease Do
MTTTMARTQICMLTAIVVMSLAAWGQATKAADVGPAENLRRTHVVRVFEANRDAVVNVNTTQVIRQRMGGMQNDPFFRRFFNIPDRQFKRTSLGSGFIVHAEGFIVTNAHVVDGADEIDVILASGKHLAAKVLALDATHDLAVLKVVPPAGVKLSVVELGDSSDLIIGEPVVTIGNPLGYEHTVTAGIVSAVNRELEVTAEWKLEGLIQTDASINPGNSGGPLLNAYGQVIGVNSAIRGDAQNIGFAIPVARLRSLIPELLAPVQLAGIDAGGSLVEERRVEPPAKVVSTVRWRANGEKGPGVVVERINGVAVGNIVEASVELLRGCQVGQKIVIETAGQVVSVVPRKAPLSDGQRLAQAMLGIAVKPISGATAQRQGVGQGALLIEAVERKGPGQAAGLEAGDLLVHLGRFRITKLEDLAAVLSGAQGGAAADVLIVRNGQLGRVRVTLRGGSGML